ncbi:sensor histidine kinase [Leucobacter insecticola]|uniref:sensor histidine kinase n=1 Tax=Leucobacter insecticola TaxID=2714934 RepID=UPI001FCB4CD3|nr:histidine kinase dimerization/phospho-acceptor domain-containing protein [Leucobacter insecticola]
MDRKRVNTSARIIGLWVGISSAVVIAAGVGALVAIILSHSRGDSDSHDDHDDHRFDRVVVDVDDVVSWILVFGIVAVVSLSLIAWATARRAVRPLAEALSAQRAFVADASHELRTPLTALDSRVQILERRLARGEPISDVVSELRRDSDGMAEILADLLLEAQLGAQHAAMPPTDLRAPSKKP